MKITVQLRVAWHEADGNHSEICDKIKPHGEDSLLLFTEGEDPLTIIKNSDLLTVEIVTETE